MGAPRWMGMAPILSNFNFIRQQNLGLPDHRLIESKRLIAVMEPGEEKRIAKELQRPSFVLTRAFEPL
jgi:hypothetical protein